MQTPGLNHIVMTTADVARSEAFYRDVLGFEVTHFDIPDLPGGMFFFAAGGVSIYFRPSDIEGDRFNESRVGLDHLSFTAPSREALDELAETLIAAGVKTRGVEQFFTGNYYVMFRDPDNMQVEYWLS